MKKNLLLVMLFLAGTAVSYCQKTSDAEIEELINYFGKQKKGAVAKLVAVPAKDSVAFWKIYDEYQQENKKAASDRVKLYERTALAYEHMTPELADSLSTEYFKDRKGIESTLQTYYKKVKKATNATVAFQFYQAEAYLLTLLRAQIMQHAPTYGELQLMNKKE